MSSFKLRASSFEPEEPSYPDFKACDWGDGQMAGLPDMLVDLRRLPGSEQIASRVFTSGVRVRRAEPGDYARLRAFVAKRHEGWGRWETAIDRTFAREPITTFVALEGGEFIGFASYDSGNRGVFGPMGVQKQKRKRGVGSALLMMAIEDMRTAGYKYAVISEVGPLDFYVKVCGATVISGSDN